MSARKPIIAVGLLTQDDIDRLGADFNRVFPLEEAGEFQGLLDAIDRADMARQTTAAPPPKG